MHGSRPVGCLTVEDLPERADVLEARDGAQVRNGGEALRYGWRLPGRAEHNHDRRRLTAVFLEHAYPHGSVQVAGPQRVPNVFAHQAAV